MNFEFLYYLSICFLLSFLIGLERQYRKRIIGLRTTILVSVGAFLFVSFSFIVGASDISRIASQVVTGIGFLGAGVILKDGKKVRGLTTAATLWCDAAIGILCAGGALKEALCGTIIILFSNTILRYINKMINNISNDKNVVFVYELSIKIENKDVINVKNDIMNYFNKLNIQISKLNIKTLKEETNISFQYMINKKDIIDLNKLSDILYKDYKIINFSNKQCSELNLEAFEDEL